MECVRHIEGGVYSVSISGKFTFADHMEFRTILEKIRDAGVRQIVLNVSQLEFVDSAALGMFLLARDEAEKQVKSLVIAGANGQVKKMFDVAKFNTLFSMH